MVVKGNPKAKVDMFEGLLIDYKYVKVCIYMRALIVDGLSYIYVFYLSCPVVIFNRDYGYIF